MSPIIQWQCTAHWRHPPAFIIGQAAAVAGLLTHHVVEREKTVAQRKCIDRYKDSVFLPQTNNQHSTYNCFLMQCEQTSHWTWSCFTAFVFILDDDSVNWKVNIGIQRNAVDMWWQKKTIVLTSLTWTFLRAFRLNFSVPWSTAGRAAKEMPKLKC